jgi:hypothetical protein
LILYSYTASKIPEKELLGFSHNFHIHVPVNDLYIPRLDPHIPKDNIEKLIPDLKELMSSLPAGTPIILFCLDNSSFLAACDEGG